LEQRFVCGSTEQPLKLLRLLLDRPIGPLAYAAVGVVVELGAPILEAAADASRVSGKTVKHVLGCRLTTDCWALREVHRHLAIAAAQRATPMMPLAIANHVWIGIRRMRRHGDPMLPDECR